MRKKLLVLGSIFMLLGSFLLINRLQKSNFTIFNQVSEEQVESIKNTLQEEAELSFTALLCNEIRVPFDDATNTFYIPLDMENSKWEKLEIVSGQPEYAVLLTEDVTLKNKKELILLA